MSNRSWQRTPRLTSLDCHALRLAMDAGAGGAIMLGARARQNRRRAKITLRGVPRSVHPHAGAVLTRSADSAPCTTVREKSIIGKRSYSSSSARVPSSSRRRRTRAVVMSSTTFGKRLRMSASRVVARAQNMKVFQTAPRAIRARDSVGRLLDKLRDIAGTVIDQLSGHDVTEFGINGVGLNADQGGALPTAADEPRSRTDGAREQGLVVYVVIGGEKHDACERIALEDVQQPQQHTIGGPTITRLDDHILRRKQPQIMPPMALVLPPDNRANAFSRHDALRSL